MIEESDRLLALLEEYSKARDEEQKASARYHLNPTSENGVQYTKMAVLSEVTKANLVCAIQETSS